MNQINSKRALLSLLISVAIAIPNVSIPASAVTFGSLVPDPASDAPYVVSIWTSENNDSRNAEFRCTGTLIAPQIVLTAAHCTTEVGSYFVKVKSQALKDKTPFTSVSGVWTSPRYDARNFTNDIGLLKLDETFTDIEFPSLANSLAEKSVNKFSKLRIYGWGRDQDKKLADLLRTADLLLQDSTAAKTFGKSFNKKTMISAGKRIVTEKVWSGACNGDSGGPLITKINDINVIVGITSWGAANCIAGKPSIFARVSYYLNDIKSGIKAVQTQSEVVNRTAPIAVVDPSIQGEAVPGRNLTCFKGEWKNAVSVQMTWLSPARLLGSTKPEITVLASDGGSEFRCAIDAFSKNASVKRNLTKSIIGKATLVSKPAISGLQPGAIIKPGMAARCEGWNWQAPVDSERVEWFTSATALPSTPVNGRTLGQGATLSLTSENIRGEKGRYLVCQVTGIKDGFESHFTSAFLLNTAVAPSLSFASISGFSLSEGSSLTCQYSSFGDIDETRIEWGTSAGSNSINPFPGVQGANISINRSIIQQGAGRNLACRVTVINSGGEAVKVATSNSSFESAPTAPTISTNLFGTPVVGSSATCSANSSGAAISYQWGLTRTAGARSFEGSVLGTSSSYTITSGSLEQLAGSFLTCIATATNNAGTSQSASSISIPSNTTTIPQPTAPVVETQIASSTSISIKIRVPAISGFDGSKMVASLNVASAPNCTNLRVIPGSTYDCAGLSANATYTANVSISSSSGQAVTNTSPNVSFTTIGLSTSLYVCGQSCTGTLTNSAMQYYISDKRAIEANAESGGPITSSTCTGSGCNPGTAPALPVACSTGSNERTNVTANATAQITTHFRYCSAPTDQTPPVISSGTLARTGYAPIVPTSGAAGASISVRFVATDNIGIANTSVRLINPGNAVVASASGSFIAGSVSDGVYSATIATAVSGPLGGDIYQIQVQARDASGNSSAWFNLGSYTISSQGVLPTFGAPQISSVASTSVIVIQPARPSNWLNSYEVIAEVYSSDEGTRIGASSEGSYYSPGKTQSVSANNPGGIAPGNVYKVRFALRDSISNRYTYGPFTTFTTPAALTAPSQPPITLITATTNTLTINWSTPASNGGAPISQYWAYVESAPAGATVGYCSTTGALTCSVSGLLANTTYHVIVSAWNTVNGVNRSSGDQFSPRTSVKTLAAPAAVVAPEVVINSGTFTSGVLTGSIAPGRSFGISWRVINTDQIATTVALIDSNGNSASWVGGALVSGTVQDGTYQGSLSVPANFAAGRYLICAIAISSNNKRSASQCGSRSEYVQVAELQVNTAPIIITPSKYSGTDAYSGIVSPGRGQFWELGFQNAVSVSVVASSPGETDIVAPFSNNWGGTVVIAVADGMSVGQKLYKAAIYVPVSTPNNKLFTLTWTATSATGHTLVVTEGSFNTGP